MSARPFVPRLEGEELDLLISRSLDGDLSPEETRDLETVLANDPAARRRQEELAAMVAEARALPSPAPPFALSTRVNANVSEKTARGGSIFHRFGFYPPPGLAIGATVVLAVAAVAITVMGPAPSRVASTIAERTDGPVEVFFQEGKRAKDSAKKAAPLPGESVGAKIAAKEKARDEGAASLSAPASEPSGAPASRLESNQVASVVASNEPLLDKKQSDDENDKQNRLSKSEVDADTGARRIRQAAAESPDLSAAAPQAAGGVSPVAPAAPAPAAPAPAAQAPAARALKPAEIRTWSVAIRGEGARRWMLRRAPESRPPASSAAASSFRVTLDAEGRVTAVRALDARAVQPALMEFVRGLVFAPVGSSAQNAVGSVADGFAREREQRAKDERTDAISGLKADKAPENPSEIEVEVSAH